MITETCIVYLLRFSVRHVQLPLGLCTLTYFFVIPWPFGSGLWRIVFSSRPPLPASNFKKHVSHIWDNLRAKGLLFGPMFILFHDEKFLFPAYWKNAGSYHIEFAGQEGRVSARSKNILVRTLLSRFTEQRFFMFFSFWVFGIYSYAQCFSVYGGLGFLRGSLVLRV